MITYLCVHVCGSLLPSFLTWLVLLSGYMHVSCKWAGDGTTLPTEPPVSKALLSPETVGCISLMYGCFSGGS
jgi:hypothetical protein